MIQQRNNAITATVFLALIFLAAIPMDWLTVRTLEGARTLTAKTGHLDFPGVASLPIWLPLCGSAALTLVAGLNYLRTTTVPFLLLATTLAAGGGYYLLAFFTMDDPLRRISVSVGAGPYVALLATGAATLLALRRPLPTSPWKPGRPLPRPVPATTATLRRRA